MKIHFCPPLLLVEDLRYNKNVNKGVPPMTYLDILKISLDPFCFPQLTNDPFRLPNQTYAQALMDYINFTTNTQRGYDHEDPRQIVIY